MPQSPQSSSQEVSSKDESAEPGVEPGKLRSEEWVDIKDPGERRKIQNKLAQRRFRDKMKEEKEDEEREAENQQKAGNSYASPEPEDIDNKQNLSGLPWGGISIKHIVETGKNRERNSQQSSRKTSVPGSVSRIGG